MIWVPIDKENVKIPKTAFVYKDLLVISLYILVKFLRVFSEQKPYEKENQLTYFTLTAMNKK